MLVYAFAAMGWASWFHPQDFSPAIRTTSPWVCAMNPPMRPGEHVVISNLNNGHSSHCIITGSGPGYGRVLDAGPRVRDELGFMGVTRVRVYKVVGHIPRCHFHPLPVTCKTPPPELCVVDLPKPIIVKECS